MHYMRRLCVYTNIYIFHITMHMCDMCYVFFVGFAGTVFSAQGAILLSLYIQHT